MDVDGSTLSISIRLKVKTKDSRLMLDTLVGCVCALVYAGGRVAGSLVWY